MLIRFFFEFNINNKRKRMVLRLTLNQTISNLQKTVYCNGVELNAELFFYTGCSLKATTL